MPKAKAASGLKAWGQIRIENDRCGLIYQSPPEEVEVRSYWHHLYERQRIVYCQLTRGVSIPAHYRTGELPPHGFLFEVAILKLRIHTRRVTLWLKEHHLVTFST